MLLIQFRKSPIALETVQHDNAEEFKFQILCCAFLSFLLVELVQIHIYLSGQLHCNLLTFSS